MVFRVQDNCPIESLDVILSSHLFFYYPCSFYLCSIFIPITSAQQNFCPASAAEDASMACYECYQTHTCNQDERCIKAQCCLAKCYPACGGRTGPECSRYSCACKGEGSSDEVVGDGMGDGIWIVIIGMLVILVGGLALGTKNLASRKIPKR